MRKLSTVTAVLMCALFLLGSTPARALDEIFIVNKCHEAIRIFFVYRPAPDIIMTSGWFDVAKDATSVFQKNGFNLTHTRGFPLYFYAETASGDYTSQSNAVSSTEQDNRTYPVQRAYTFIDHRRNIGTHITCGLND